MPDKNSLTDNPVKLNGGNENLNSTQVIRDNSGGKPVLDNDMYNPDIVNKRSAEFYSVYGNNPSRGSLSNVEARKWYLDREANIPSLLDSTQPMESQAKQAFDLRNEFRSKARELMQDRIAADRLVKEENNIGWDDLKNKVKESLINQGVNKFTDDDIYREIIISSQRSRKNVNKALGL